jgi:hypothetical protein
LRFDPKWVKILGCRSKNNEILIHADRDPCQKLSANVCACPVESRLGRVRIVEFHRVNLL